MNLKDKKLKMTKRLRTGVYIALGSLSILMLIMLILTWTKPGIKEDRIILYKYSHKAEVDYRVFLHRNPIFAEESLGKGQFYLTPFVNNIRTVLTYQFNGNRDTHIKGSYEVVAYMQGIQREMDNIKIIWSKTYTLLENQNFETIGKGVAIKKEIPLELKPYNDFVGRFFEDYKIQTEVVLNIYWKIRIEAETDKDPIKEQLVPVMTIPLNTKYFQISGEHSNSKDGVVDVISTKPAPVNKTRAAVYLALTVILVSGLLFVRYRTECIPVNIRKLQLMKIKKNYGDRLAELSNAPEVKDGRLLVLKSFEDLVRTADELNKPIMYLIMEDKSVFYVLDEPQLYIFELFL